MTSPAQRIADDEAASWCVRLAADPFDPETQDGFEAWVVSDPVNAATFERAVTVWQGVDAIKDTPEMLGFRADAVQALRRANVRRWSGGITLRWRRCVAMAGCLAVLLILGLRFLPSAASIYETGIGERRVAVLEDGSRLTLDAATRVEVRMDRHRRNIELIKGRAKFDVAHDPLRPLSVLARNRLTVATGTSFSVELLPRQMRVVLYVGQVEVMAQNAQGTGPNLLAGARAGGALLPGRELVASTVGTQVRIADTDVTRSLDWENGQISFDGEPLALAVERINRDARNMLVVADRRIAGYQIVGTFNAGDTEAFIEGISALHPIHVVRERDTLVLKGEN